MKLCPWTWWFPFRSWETSGKTPGLTCGPDEYKLELKLGTKERIQMMADKRKQWPVLLFWLPYDSPSVFSLGPVSSSFLIQKRLRLPRTGCFAAWDVNSEPRRDPDLADREEKIKENVVPNNLQGCKRESRNARVARAAVKLLRADQGLEKEGCSSPLPRRIRCGHLRSTIRQQFPASVTVTQELSIKTAQKLELSPCKSCSAGLETELSEWKEERFRHQRVDAVHLAAFRKACACLVKRGWNLRKYPYIPNGSASESFSRKDGGNWRSEDFSPSCRTELVYSSGKPRVVTLYSSYNVSVLTPLHRALYHSLRQEGWLLVGSPTDEQVRSLGRGVCGPYVSVDYSSATDNIKSAYVSTMVDVLVQKSVELTPDEIRCLRVLDNLRFDRDGPVASRGQPMGSPMSFPLLCLINKAVVDLALADLQDKGEISAKQFVEHRCLVNGDDLLLREFTPSSRGVLSGIRAHGSECGLVVNESKTMVDALWAEINSTAFFRGVKQKKTNVSVLQVRSSVSDPVGFLADSVVKRRSFVGLLRKWARPLANTFPKLQGPVPAPFFSALVKAKGPVREALLRVPRARPNLTNPFPVVPKPAGYFLSREEEVASINERVDRLKSSGYRPPKSRWVAPGDGGRQTIRAAVKRGKTTDEDNVLKVLADRWYWLTKERMVKEDDASVDAPVSTWDQADCDYHEGNVSTAEYFVRCLRAFRRGKKEVRDLGLDGGVPDPPSNSRVGVVARDHRETCVIVEPHRPYCLEQQS